MRATLALAPARRILVLARILPTLARERTDGRRADPSVCVPGAQTARTEEESEEAPPHGGPRTRSGKPPRRPRREDAPEAQEAPKGWAFGGAGRTRAAAAPRPLCGPACRPARAELRPRGTRGTRGPEARPGPGPRTHPEGRARGPARRWCTAPPARSAPPSASPYCRPPPRRAARRCLPPPGAPGLPRARRQAAPVAPPRARAARRPGRSNRTAASPIAFSWEVPERAEGASSPRVLSEGASGVRRTPDSGHVCPQVKQNVKIPEGDFFRHQGTWR